MKHLWAMDLPGAESEEGHPMKHLRDGDVVEALHKLRMRVTGVMNNAYMKAFDAGCRSALDDMENAIAALPDAREWLPIETAPKDGRELILIITSSRFPQVAYSNTWWRSGFSVECKPTHWAPILPLPDAPKEQT